MNHFYRLYRPATAVPHRNDSTYTEITPCSALRPYIKCFWGSVGPSAAKATAGELIIPDTCMDIIFEINHSQNSMKSRFVGINNEAFFSAGSTEEKDTSSTFGIRFFAWSAAMFSQDSMNGVKNKVFDVQYHYEAIKTALEPILYEVTDIHARAREAEKILLRRLDSARHKPVLDAAIGALLARKGNIRTTSLADEVFLSTRQLERLFADYTGVSPKQLSSLVRYQYLWHDILTEDSFHPANAVHKYGYTDQSHLLHDFKRYHTLLPAQAKDYALKKADILRESNTPPQD